MASKLKQDWDNLCTFSLIAIVFALGLFFGASFLATNVLKNPGVEYTLMSLAPAIIFVAMSAVLRGYFVGMGSMMEYSKAQVIEQIVRVAIIVIGSYIFVNVLNLGPTKAVGIAVFAATIGALIALLYLLIKIRLNKKELMQNEKQTKEENKQRFWCWVPF